MIKKETKVKKTMGEIFKEFDAVFSMNISEGFANISFDDKNETRVQFLNDEGYAYDLDEINLPLKDIEKVGRFMAEMKELKLEEYKS